MAGNAFTDLGTQLLVSVDRVKAFGCEHLSREGIDVCWWVLYKPLLVIRWEAKPKLNAEFIKKKPDVHDYLSPYRMNLNSKIGRGPGI